MIIDKKKKTIARLTNYRKYQCRSRYTVNTGSYTERHKCQHISYSLTLLLLAINVVWVEFSDRNQKKVKVKEQIPFHLKAEIVIKGAKNTMGEAQKWDGT